MGTRGTLRIYVNGELKVRQYNQWDSYPTGQFNNICEFFKSRLNLHLLTYSLINREFAKREEVEAILEGRELDNSYLRILIDRDLGANVLWLLAGIPVGFRKIIPDWVDVHRNGLCTGVGEEDTELPPEEGNYVIHIECEINPSSIGRNYIKKDTEPRFRLSGEWHGVEREYDWGYIPTDEEIQAWEKEGYDA